jgi:hypothetical protein
MKAMEKDRNRRYATPNALALDVDRFLEKEAVQRSVLSTLTFQNRSSPNCVGA